MDSMIDIRDVARKTGLSSRALRFYEAKGLIAPLRTASGRRLFGAAQLARLHQIVVLKSAGLSLMQMKQMFDGKPIDLPAMLGAQLKMLEEESARIASSQTLIHFVLSRIDCGEPIDAETFCSLIESGDRMMDQEPKEWKEVTDRYFTPAEKAEWAQKWAQLPDDFDADGYQAAWQELGTRIKAALPLTPESAAAQAFVDEWYALLQPFAAVASPEMWNGAVKMYDNMDAWAGQGEGAADPGFDKSVWDFMKLATASRLAAGGSIAPLAPGYWADKGN
jgi:DNA-binding transcriptional MerR regulator